MTTLVTDPLLWWSRTAPDRSAITFDGTDTITYAGLDAWTDAVAHHLVALGVSPGDRIGLVGPNTLEWCAVALGALKVGAIVACFQHRLGPSELGYLAEDSRPTVVFAGPDHLDSMAASSERLGFPVEAIADVANLREVRDGPAFDRRELDPDEAAIIVYTSGTTAAPKGVVFTHRTTFSFIFEQALMEPAFRQEARMLFVLSLGGAPGILWALLHMLSRGAHLYLERGFDPEVALRRLAEEQIEILMSVPFMLEQMAQRPEFADADLSAIEYATSGGARVPEWALEAWLAKGVPVRQLYGMTELGGTSTSNRPEEAMGRPSSVGYGQMFTRHRVVRTDGTDCDAEEQGEIIVRGPSVTPGYWGKEDETRKVLRDGWFHTGDLGVFDREGFLRVVDRLKDIIITGGFNVAPAEVEQVIDEIDGVDEVAVIAVADEKFGEAVGAVISSATGVAPDDVITHCRARLAGYKVPRQVYVDTAPLPRMPSGKLAKRALREEYGTVK